MHLGLVSISCDTTGSTNTLASLDILLKVSLCHEVLHIHISWTLWKNNTTVLLLELNVSHIVSWVLNTTDLEEVLVSSLVGALTIIFAILGLE